MQRSLNKKGWGVVAIGVASLALAIGMVFGTHTFTLPEDEIRAKVESVLPIDAEGVSVTEVVIDLSSESNDVALEVTGTATRMERSFTFTLAAVGVPEYQFTTGTFYFRPTKVKLVSLEQTGGDTVAGTVEKAADFAKKLFPKRDEVVDELAYAADQLAPDVQAWLEGKAEGAAVYVLQRAPIYTLPNDAKGIAAQAVLDDVRIENNSLVIELSLYRLGIWVLIFGLVALVTIGALFAGLGPLFVF